MCSETWHSENAVRGVPTELRAQYRSQPQVSLNSETRAEMLVLASPKSIRVFSLKKRGFWTPANPEAMERLSTKTVRAWSSLMMAVP